MFLLKNQNGSCKKITLIRKIPLLISACSVSKSFPTVVVLLIYGIISNGCTEIFMNPVKASNTDQQHNGMEATPSIN